VVSLLAIIGAVALLPATATFVAVAVGLGVGYVTHTTTQDIVETIGAKAIGSMEQNPLDRIHSLERQQQLGRKITPEQVMSVYVATDPQLDMKIRRDPEFGKPFDRLPLAQKHKAILTHGKDLGIQEVTDSINQNRFSARELAFSVCGERSGAYAEPTLYQEMQGKLSSLKQGLDKGRLVAAQKWDGMVSRISSPKQEETVEAVAPAKEWVKDLGLQPPAAVDEQIGGWVAKREAELAARHTPSSQQIH
jgi:hypothetical protein